MPADIDACVEALKGKPGVDNPHALCNWMKANKKGFFAAKGGGKISDADLAAAIDATSRISRTVPVLDCADDERIFVPFTRLNKGKRMVYGYGVTTERPHSGRMPLTMDAIKDALPAWMEFRNIREMHQLSAVGKAHEVEIDETGAWIGAKITDDKAWEKVVDGVYTGFSIGGKILEKKNGFVTKFRCDEFSVVDAPDIPKTNFQDVYALWRRGEPTDKLKPEDEGMDIELLRTKLTEVKTAVDGLKGVAQTDGLKRSLYNVEQMVRFLDGLTFMRSNVKVEESMEGDVASTMPKLMDELVAFFAHVTTMMMAEEVGEVAPKAAEGGEPAEGGEVSPPTATEEAVMAALKPEDLVRGGAKFSKGTLKVLRDIVRSIQGLTGMTVQSDEDMDASIKAAADAAAEKDKADKEAAAAAEKKGDEKTAAEKDEDDEAGKEKKDETQEAAAPPAEDGGLAQIGDLARRLDEMGVKVETLEKEKLELVKKVEELSSRAAPAKLSVRETGGMKTIDKSKDNAVARATDLQRAADEAIENGDTRCLTLLSLKGYQLTPEQHAKLCEKRNGVIAGRG